MRRAYTGKTALSTLRFRFYWYPFVLLSPVLFGISDIMGWIIPLFSYFVAMTFWLAVYCFLMRPIGGLAGPITQRGCEPVGIPIGNAILGATLIVQLFGLRLDALPRMIIASTVVPISGECSTAAAISEIGATAAAHTTTPSTRFRFETLRA
jgi:hypothetical protein